MPILVSEILDLICITEEGFYVDGTLGGGGHTFAILQKLSNAKVFGIDLDEEALKQNQERFPKDRFVACPGNFRDIENLVKTNGIDKVVGVLLDLGISSHQIDSANRGFSFQKDAQLDMRMSKQTNLTAKKIVNSYSREDLSRIFREFGEEKNAWRIAGEIVREREKKEVETTLELVKIISKVAGGKFLVKTLARIFQALRIEVNQELENLKEALQGSLNILVEGGRLGVISYHSLEDRIVKDFFKHENLSCVCPKVIPVCVCKKKRTLNILTKNPMVPSENEIKQNSRARSAKLRVIEKI
ncbi:16S rRNA (cytosine(1402)-N(4))-methyltransferase RsmH [bacterium]|nr:16S rRNA (cytosine(1402)-N(4))-methyltransferase RsmH [bacterium]